MFSGEITCEANQYREDLRLRREREAQTLASLTGWPIQRIRKKAGITEPVAVTKWYEKLWDR